jgi:hypothetical protein
MSVLTAEAEVLWRFLNGRQEASCVMQPHPTAGMEVLYFYNGVKLIGVVSPDLDELHQRALQWRMRLVAEGWSEAERRVRPTASPLKVRRAGAKG